MGIASHRIKDRNMGDQIVETRIIDRVCILTLNDPERLNAMSHRMSALFKKTVTNIREKARVLVLTGKGRAFCAGGDLDEIAANYGQDPGRVKQKSFDFYADFLCICSLGIPTIAAVNGMAVGAGACLAMACDMRMAARDASFRFPFVRLGLHPGMGAEFFLQQAVGQAKTFELLLTGEAVSASQALDMGMVNHVVSGEALMDQTLDLARKISAMPALPVRMLKESVPAALRSTLEETLARQASFQAINYMTGDFKEGIDALREKRRPRFKDGY